MHTTKFDSSYTAFTTDGAQYLASHLPNVKTVGIDYLSIARFEDLSPAHVALFEKVGP
jgi:kynurenine formamidase